MGRHIGVSHTLLALAVSLCHREVHQRSDQSPPSSACQAVATEGVRTNAAVLVHPPPIPSPGLDAWAGRLDRALVLGARTGRSIAGLEGVRPVPRFQLASHPLASTLFGYAEPNSLWRECCVAETVPASAGQGAAAPLYSKESIASGGDAAMRQVSGLGGRLQAA
jgi:hypothetical protein